MSPSACQELRYDSKWLSVGDGPECLKPGMHNATRAGMPNGLNA